MQRIKGVDDPIKKRFRSKEDRPFRGKRFVMDIHGHRKEDFDALVKFFDTDAVDLACIAKEFGQNKVHPHWQIYFEIVKHTDSIRKIMINDVLGHDRFYTHWAKGTRQQNINYLHAVNCQRDQNYNNNGKDEKLSKEAYEAGFIEYTKNVPPQEAWLIKKKPHVDFWRNFKPRPFQKFFIDNFTSKSAGDRTIHFLFEPTGNTGKSKLLEYLHIFHGAIVTGGTASDMKHAVVRWGEIVGVMPIIICVDVARSDKFNAESAKAIEGIKNGIFFSGKYESAMAHSFDKPHILIISNVKPNISLFSVDRYRFYTIDNDHNLIKIKSIEDLKKTKFN